MNKKDRIATVISIFYLIGYVMLMVNPAIHAGGVVSLFFLPVLIYWGYRFIKDDISFINIRDK